MTKPVEQTWAMIRDWLQSTLPEALDNLRPPANDAQIEEVEKKLSLQCPPGLKALYRLHDGESNNWPPGVLDDAHWFLPLHEVAQHYEIMSTFDYEIMSTFAEPEQDTDFATWKELIEDHAISIKGPVKTRIFSAKWLPITSSNGDVHRYIDFDPAPGGTVGQVIEHYPEACRHMVLAQSFDEYLANYAGDLLSGRYEVDGDCIVDNNGDDGTKWGLPEYLA